MFYISPQATGSTATPQKSWCEEMEDNNLIWNIFESRDRGEQLKIVKTTVPIKRAVVKKQHLERILKLADKAASNPLKLG